MSKYLTKDGDMLDNICYKNYGVQEGVVELVLQANQNLSEQPEVLSTGIYITLPDLPIPLNDITPIRIWE
ncbi:MAG: tail protein X [Methylococcales bacterium]|nr:tail protein X [Methylococcales bacterium]